MLKTRYPPAAAPPCSPLLPPCSLPSSPLLPPTPLAPAFFPPPSPPAPPFPSSHLGIDLDHKVHPAALLVVRDWRVGAVHILALAILGLEGDVLANGEAQAEGGGVAGGIKD